MINTMCPDDATPHSRIYFANLVYQLWYDGERSTQRRYPSTMMHPTFTITVTILIAYILLIIECFLPTGGLLATLSVLCLIASIVFAFSVSKTVGCVVLFLVVAITPILINLLIRLWPSTRLGRKILNLNPRLIGNTQIQRTEASAGKQKFIDQIGHAHTDLSPNGIATILDEKMDVISDGEFIQKGAEILVTHCEMGRLYVRSTMRDPKNEKIDPSTDERIGPAIRSLEYPVETLPDDTLTDEGDH